MRNPPRIGTALLWIFVACAGTPPQSVGPSAQRAPAVPQAQRKPPEAPPVLQLPRDVHPLHYALEMRIVPDEERFSGTAEIDVQLDEPRDVIWLHGRGLDVRAASIGGMSARYEQVKRAAIPQHFGTADLGALDG